MNKTRNSIRKAIALFLTMAMILGSGVLIFGTAADPVAWDGTVASDFAGGSGTEGDPWIISTPAQWAYFAAQVTAGTTYSGKYIELNADLVFNTGNAADWATTPAANTVPRVGADGKKFCGTFDGQGHTISGIYMSGLTNDGIGLFADVSGATIQNLLVRNSYISGQDYIGTIAGEVSGTTTIQNIYVNSDVRVYSTQATSGKNAQTGGIVGACYGTPQFTLTMRDCVFAGSVSAVRNCVGGIVGAGNSSPNKHDMTFINCLVLGSVSASADCSGLFSTNNSKDGTGTVDTVITGCVYAGKGFGTYPLGSGSTNGTVTVTDSYVTQFKSGTEYAYKSQGTESAENVTLIELEDLCGIDASVTISGWTKRANDIMIPSGVAAFAPASGLPVASFEGSGTAEAPYLISTASDFAYFAEYVNNGGTTLGKYFKLTADIVMNKNETFTPIAVGAGAWASFKGDFDGDGHTISGVKVDTTASLGTATEAYTSGLFGCVGAAANIHDFLLSDSSFTGINPVGGVAGMANIGASFSNIYVDADVTVDNALGDGAGGIIGQLTSGKPGETDGARVTVDSCVNAGTIRVTKVHTKSNEGSHAGGIIGNGNGKMLSVTNCLNIGPISATFRYACGIVGRESFANAVVSKCVNFATVTCENDPDTYAREIINSNEPENQPLVSDCYCTGTNPATRNSTETNVTLISMADLIGTNAAVTIDGWTKRAGDIMLPAGVAAMMVSKQIITVSMSDGASVRLDTPTGLRFTALLGDAYLSSVKAANPGKTVTYGVIIAPTDYVTAAGAFTVEALETLGHTTNYVQIPANVLMEGGAEAGYYVFTGVLSNVRSYNYERAFSARAYLAVDGEIVAYSAYSGSKNSRSIAAVAEAAYNDTSTTQNAEYAYEIAANAGVYSPYPAAKRDLLPAFYNQVAATVNFMSYNIRNVEGGDHLLDDPLTFEYSGRNTAVRDYILAESPDVIGIQEASKKTHAYNSSTLDWFDTIGDGETSVGLTANGYTCIKGQDILNDSDKEMYNPIYYKTSKYTLVTNGFRWLTADGTKGAVEGAYKACNWAVLEDNATGLRFVYVNVHVGRVAEGQETMAGNFKSFLQTLAGTYTCPIVIAGDFNGSYSDYTGYDAFWGDTAKKVRDLSVNKTTGCSTVTSDFTAIGSSSGPIDLYFAMNTDDITFHNYAVTDNKVQSTQKYPSDHLPVKVVATLFGNG